MSINEQRRFLQGNILSEIRRKIKENDDEKVTSGLSTEISRFTFLVATRLENAKTVERQLKLNSSLTLLNQAQMLTSTDMKEARKLFNLAKRLGK